MQGTQRLLAGCFEVLLLGCCLLHHLAALADHLEGKGRGRGRRVEEREHGRVEGGGEKRGAHKGQMFRPATCNCACTVHYSNTYSCI